MKAALHTPLATRRGLLQAAAATLLAGARPAWPAADAFTWVPAQADGAALTEQLDQGVARGELPGLHGVFVARGGRVLVERYYPGPDDRWGRPLGPVAHGPLVPHDLRSVSKSVVGLLYGIALAEGRVPAPDTPLLDAFAAHADLARDEPRRAIRVADALGMSMGLAWNEDLPYNDPRNSEIAMERSADRIRYVLDRPIVAAPGTQWRYNGGTTVLLADLITRGSGLPLLRYAQDKLFTPLGITEAEWTAGPSGQPAAASGLRLRLPDLARIGQLLLQQGEWQGRTVVPKAWLTESLTPRLPAWDGLKYGYQWFIAQNADGSPVWMAIGLGGQRLVVAPSLQMVYGLTMGNYTRADQLQRTLAVQRLLHAAVR